jgi:DNA-binding response OmpR family regulator
VAALVLETLLRKQGFSPYTAARGAVALELFSKHAIPVIFTDWRMPQMDGFELCEQIKEIDDTAQVYLLSACIDHFTEEQLREAGFDGWFPKPFKMDELVNFCAEAFERLECQS